jgi:outer membrane autotransporter protein
LPAS